ncbi:MAG: methyltransferase domain-containing protein, partial [Methylobacteriaceae bacterium]|nr:methyltransferase domain-containing protein [Methylobacteriaceae bacterium]
MQANGTSENRPDVSRESYIMGRTSHEYQRLRQQAKMWEDLTARILREAGLEEGMTCLDVGCGPGEVMRLMGEIVGVQGHVVGIDVDGEIGRDALRQLRAGAKSRFSFFEHDLFGAAPVPGGPFDM